MAYKPKILSLTEGGTNASLTASNGGMLYSTASAVAILAGTATAGQMLQSGASTTPAWSTATFPATATGTGTILRADGTNWVATTSTYPNTNAVSTLLYASGTNVMAALATANSGVLSTSSAGVPSIDTTNFAVLTTGLQLKGNNTNTAPPAGFIGEQIRSAVGTPGVTVVNNTAKEVTNISLTAGIWDVSGIVSFTGTLTGTQSLMVINTSVALGTGGDNTIGIPLASTATGDLSLSIPSYRYTLSGTTTIYLVAYCSFTAGTCQAYGRISGTRVG